MLHLFAFCRSIKPNLTINTNACQCRPIILLGYLLSIVSFTLLDPPANVHQFPMRVDDQGRSEVFAIDVVMSPKQADIGVKTLCVEAMDTYL